MRTPPRAADERRLGGRLAHSRDRTATRAICGARRRCVRTDGGFRRVSSVAEARLESGERQVANRREQQALAELPMYPSGTQDNNSSFHESP